jgi:hypothetical protein
LDCGNCDERECNAQGEADEPIEEQLGAHSPSCGAQTAQEVVVRVCVQDEARDFSGCGRACNEALAHVPGCEIGHRETIVRGSFRISVTVKKVALW